MNNKLKCINISKIEKFIYETNEFKNNYKY